MIYGETVEIVAKGQVVNALVARSVEIAPHSPANGKPVKDAKAEEHVDLVYLDPEAKDQKGGPMIRVREMRHVAVSGLEKAVAAVKEAVVEAGAAVAVLLLFALMLLAPAMAQQPVTHLVWATDYATSNLAGQQPNTYTWNLGSAPGPGSCAAQPNNTNPSFFVFGATARPYPQFIRDATPALSEVFTPAATQLTGSSCGFTGTPNNAHTTFWVSSGTSGLYEAVATSSALSSITNVLLDRSWYAAEAALPAQVTATVIAAAPGSAHVQIVDTTTTPWTWYSWTGAAYAVAGVGTTPTLAGVNTFTAVNNFQNAVTTFGISAGTTGTLRLYNAGAAFYVALSPAQPSANYTLTIPALGAGDTIATLGLANTFTGANIYTGANSFRNAVTNFGAVSATTGTLVFYNANAAFTTTVTTGTPTGSYVLTIPPLSAADTIATLGLANTFTGANVFNNALTTFGSASTVTGALRLYNSGAAFATTITTAQPSGAYTLTIPAMSAGDTIATLGLANTFTGANVFNNALTTFGSASTVTGALKFFNSGAAFYVTLTPAQPSGNYTLTIPTLGAVDTIATLKLANVFTGINTFNNATTNFGLASTTTGTAVFYNAGSANAVTVASAAQTGGSFSLTIPALGAGDTVATLGLGNTFTAANNFNAATTNFGVAGSTTGIVKVNAAGAGGSVSLTPVAALTSAITDTLSIYSGGLPVVLSCGSTGSGNQTCTPGAVNGKQQIYVGESTLSGDSATITFPNTFTSTTSYFCIGQDVTTRANPVQMVPASGTTATITNTTGATDVIQWICTGN